MERSIVFPMPRKISKNKPINTKTDILKHITQEYSLKRNTFNPKSISPNIFLNKLELRMKLYYNNL